MKRFIMVGAIAALTAVIVWMAPDGPREARASSSPSQLDSVNIGDTTSEAGHDLAGWSNVWSGCGWCSADGNMRLIWGDGGQTCQEADRTASLVLNAGGMVAQSLKVHHLDGAADDGFNVYVNGDLVGTYVATPETGNPWYTTDFDISSGGYTGSLTISLEATGAAWGGCGTYGQVAFSWLELWGGPLPVRIDIKPGSDPNCINPDSNGNGVIPVAILGSATFDASQVNAADVTLDGVGVRLKGKSGGAGSLEDVNGDGYLDLVVHIQDWTLVAGSATATLTGYLSSGTAIQGSDSICIVPPDA